MAYPAKEWLRHFETDKEVVAKSAALLDEIEAEIDEALERGIHVEDEPGRDELGYVMGVHVENGRLVHLRHPALTQELQRRYLAAGYTSFEILDRDTVRVRYDAKDDRSLAFG
jgi:hypothetical protein